LQCKYHGEKIRSLFVFQKYARDLHIIVLVEEDMVLWQNKVHELSQKKKDHEAQQKTVRS
jgi:hypothetical protein